MTFLRYGAITARSRVILPWKIECDGLTADDWECVARIVATRFAFGRVVGVPRGGLPFAEALRLHAVTDHAVTAIVDDVLTTGAAMEEARAIELRLRPEAPVIGFVAFARGAVPNWVWPVFTVSEWAQSRGTGLG